MSLWGHRQMSYREASEGTGPSNIWHMEQWKHDTAKPGSHEENGH